MKSSSMSDAVDLLTVIAEELEADHPYVAYKVDVMRSWMVDLAIEVDSREPCTPEGVYTMDVGTLQNAARGSPDGEEVS